MRLEISVPDSLFKGAQGAATAKGVTVDAYMADALQKQLQNDPEDDLAWFFTPKRIAEIREAAEEARTGNNLSPEEVEAHFAQKRKEWAENHRV